MSTPRSDEAELLGRVRRSRLRKAGLGGAYLAADCELGRRVDELARRGRGAYLWGRPGRGKTYAAACAVRLAMERAGYGLGATSGGVEPPMFPARIVTTAELLAAERAAFDGGEGGALERAAGCWLLVLDDIGAERATDWAVEQLTRLVDRRVADGLPIVCTSNLPLGRLGEAWGGMPGERLVSRLAGACERIEVAGADRRLAAWPGKAAVGAVSLA